jgi:hypothetical protein
MVVRLKFLGTGYRGNVSSGSGPLRWNDILNDIPTIIIGSLIFTFITSYFDYWDFIKKQNNNK